MMCLKKLRISFVIGLTLTISAVAESKIKNVLLLISDDLKASTLSCYGDPLVQTPNIDALAAQGMVFNRAYCQGMTCGPSRQSFMFSRYKGDHGTSLGQNFINNEIYSARVGKIFHMKVPGDIVEGANGDDYAECWTERFNSPGLEVHTAGKYSLFNHNIFTYSMKDRASTAEKDRWFVSVEYEGDGSDQPDWKTASKTIDLLRKHKDKPFFIAAGFVRPHYPNVAPQQYFDKYPYADVSLPEQVEGDLDDIPEIGYTDVRSGTDPIGLYPDNQKRMWAAYYATITYMDEQLGRIVEELERLGLRESTAIVFMSDHGYHLGEHTFWQKNNLHEDVTRVPLIISAPGLKPGRSDAFVELVDMYPTVSDMMGVAVPDTVQGKSLVPILKNPAASVREEAFSVGNSGSGFALRGDAWTYIHYKDDTEELYDMKKDPKQFTNLAGDPKYARVLETQRAKLNARVAAAGLQRG
jgi:iduronate 2-sulfatase